MYTTTKNQIIINDLSQFNILQILKSGQIFSYDIVGDKYYVYSADKKAIVNQTQKMCVIQTDDVDYFVNFFDLNKDYNNDKMQILEKYPNLKEIVEFGYGIRLLNQDKLEMFITWVISANNNIPRIMKAVKYIRVNAGEKKQDYYTFPTLEKLKELDEKFFIGAGCGYRSKQLKKLIDSLSMKTIEEYDKLNTFDLKKKLESLSGIGSKVADCIMLSAYKKADVFPVDTWIEKMFHTYFNSKENNRNKIREELVNTFKNYSSYVQQLFFYYMLNNK